MSELLRTQADLAALLSPSIGVEKAASIVATAAAGLGYGQQLTQQQSLELLETIAAESGIVGISARFAKSRVLLRWSSDAVRRPG